MILNILKRISELNKKKAFQYTFYTYHVNMNFKLSLKINSGNLSIYYLKLNNYFLDNASKKWKQPKSNTTEYRAS